MASTRLLILFLSYWVSTFAGAQPPAEPAQHPDFKELDQVPDDWRDRVAEARMIYEGRTSQPPSGELRFACHRIYKMEVIISEDPHLYVNNPGHHQPDKFRLHGPAGTGKWTVDPVNGAAGPWHHPWKENVPYTAIPIPLDNPATDAQGRYIRFSIYDVKVSPHGAEPERAHEYEMRFTTWNASAPCPAKIEFLSVRHLGGPVSDHPGHGGAGIN